MEEQENNVVDVVEEEKGTAEPEQTETPQDEKKYTDADVDEIINKKYAKWKAEQEAKQDEAKRLSKMNADQKKEYQLNQREQALKDREAEIARKELTAEAKATLSERGLPIDLLEAVDLTDADSVLNSINQLQKTWQVAVQKGVEERLKGSAPMKRAPESTKVTKEQFDRMGYASRNELLKNDPELYNQLNKKEG